MAYTQNFKSPILKALVGKQGNLPQHLQDAIKAAPESPAKKAGPGDKKKNIQKGTVNAARQLLKDSTSINNPNLSDAEVIRAAKVKGVWSEASSRAKRAAAGGATNYDYESPAKQSIPGFNKNSKAAKNAAARRKTKTSIPPSLGGSATKAATNLVKKGVKNQKDVFGRAGYNVKKK